MSARSGARSTVPCPLTVRVRGGSTAGAWAASTAGTSSRNNAMALFILPPPWPLALGPWPCRSILPRRGWLPRVGARRRRAAARGFPRGPACAIFAAAIGFPSSGWPGGAADAVPAHTIPPLEREAVKVIIPLAGKGTRLRPHTHTTPKPLLRVGGRPVMSYILDDLKELGVNEAIFITGHLKEAIERYIGAEYPEFTSHFVEQPVQNGTAGAVALAEPWVDGEVLIIFVDTLFDADLSLVKRLDPGIAGVIWAKEVEDYQRFGVVVTDAEHNMTRIVEKPAEPISKAANIGLYYIRDWQLLFEGIRHTMQSPTGKAGEYYLTDAFQYMIDQGAKIRVAEVGGWYDCGQLDTLLETNRHLLEHGRALRPEGGRGVRVHDPVRIAAGVTLEDCEVGPNVTVEAGCTIRASALRDTIVGAHTTIEHARLHGSLIGNHVIVRHARGAVSLGDHATVDLRDGE
ncbi:MAG: nucleotidyltransferase [Gemmatimonadetes bacterium]|nr:nucleotidyltransferase [Gemmatimonadota bacterium]